MWSRNEWSGLICPPATTSGHQQEDPHTWAWPWQAGFRRCEGCTRVECLAYQRVSLENATFHAIELPLLLLDHTNTKRPPPHLLLERINGTWKSFLKLLPKSKMLWTNNKSPTQQRKPGPHSVNEPINWVIRGEFDFLISAWSLVSCIKAIEFG